MEKGDYVRHKKNGREGKIMDVEFPTGRKKLLKYNIQWNDGSNELSVAANKVDKIDVANVPDDDNSGDATASSKKLLTIDFSNIADNRSHKERRISDVSDSSLSTGSNSSKHHTSRHHRHVASQQVVPHQEGKSIWSSMKQFFSLDNTDYSNFLTNVEGRIIKGRNPNTIWAYIRSGNVEKVIFRHTLLLTLV